MMGLQAPRRSAKEIIEELARLQDANPDARDRVSMLHEISVYQEELVVQNEELIHAQGALEETRDRFIELYDFAPSGYLTLDEHGVIRECNLTAASMLGKSKQALAGLPFLGFVAAQDRAAYLTFLRQCRTSTVLDVETELTLNSVDGPKHVQFLCRHRPSRGGSREYLTGLVDVTERRQIEREREQLGTERAALASRLIAGQDDERLRIARNLHDDVGQQVTSLRLKLEELVSAVSKASVGDGLAEAQEMLRHLDQRLHYVASELRPAALDLGLLAAMEQFVREWSATFSVPGRFHSARIEPGTLAPQVETHLYRIAQEALNNAAQYATATQVAVLLERRDDGVVLIVEDDGSGFDLEEVRRQGQGLGLVGMRERAQLVGARLEVETAPGRGTSVFVHVPKARLNSPA